MVAIDSVASSAKTGIELSPYRVAAPKAVTAPAFFTKERLVIVSFTNI
jgi:hypothetical protein